VRRSSLILRRLVRFVRLSIAALFSGRDPSRRPVPKLVLRVGVVGHLDLPERATVAPFVARVLSSLRQSLTAANGAYVDSFRPGSERPESECRLVTQLAAGADQLVADQAIRLGYALNGILPIDMPRYAEDLRRNPGVDADPAGELARLAASATALLELDGEVDDEARELTKRTYETSALTLLGHADVLLALVRSGAEKRRGGTRWLIDEAETRGMPVILVVVDALDRSHLAEGPVEARTETPLAGEDWAQRLVQSLLLQQTRSYEPSDWFEERFRAHVTANEAEWALQWNSGSARAPTLLRDWLARIREDYFSHWLWAERCANAYRDLYQGAYISISLLALTAVGGALLGALDAGWSTFGKWLELAALVVLLVLWQRARSRHWREGWLGYRLLEQQINHAAVLAVLGRTIPSVDSPALREFQREGAWIDRYLRAVLRQARLPSGRLEQPIVMEAGHLILSGMIDRQVDYYGAAIDVNRRANERLEVIAMVSLVLTLVTAALYLFVHYYAEQAWHWRVDPFRQVALGAGIFFPALAATLAAIRTQSEFLQLATRFRGMHAHLQVLRDRLARTLDEAAARAVPLLSAQIARYAMEAARSMLDEVSQWRSLLFTHEIER